ncbi:MAG: glycosyltransferase family 1 protein [Bacteroidetes bacterium SW_11_45_7]|nr:MAG: glycosyltransferase family 1 protein [Bacteroidetes bacterium SW_11_45_7]
MKIAVNTRFLLPDHLEGIGWFTCETFRQLTRQHPEHEFHFFFDRSYSDTYLFSDNITPHVLQPPARHPVLWYWWFEWSVVRKLKQLQPDLFISPDGFLSLNTQIPTLLVIHDLAFEHFPSHIGKLARQYYRRYTPLFTQKAARIATVSEYSKQDIVSQYRVAPDKIDVVYNGSNGYYRALSKEQQRNIRQHLTNGKEYFLFAGALQPRKNVANLLRAFDQFKQKTGSTTQLILVGRKAWHYDGIMEAYNEMNDKADVQFLGHKNAVDLSGIMGAAKSLVYVSRFEGFGIPLLEAMQAEVPVITSNTSSMPEIAGEAAWLTDPYSVESIADAMMKIDNDKKLRQQLVDAGKNQRQKFSWQQTANELWESVEKTVYKREKSGLHFAGEASS